MSAVAMTTRYRRRHDLLWRDTGLHVLVLPPGLRGDVVVLGGGGAAVWRLLEDAEDVAGLLGILDPRTTLGTGTGEAPSPAEVQGCLAELLGLHVIELAGEEPR